MQQALAGHYQVHRIESYRWMFRLSLFGIFCLSAFIGGQFHVRPKDEMATDGHSWTRIKQKHHLEVLGLLTRLPDQEIIERITMQHRGSE